MKAKKLMMFVTMLCIFALPLIGAKASTDMNVEWDGLGYVSGTFTPGDDAVVDFWAEGYTHGEFHAQDADDNPYNYQVDTISSQFKGYVDDGGELYFGFNRTDSWTSMYGPADQWTESYLGCSGTGQLIFRTRSNFADLDSSNYGYQADNQFLASGEYYAWHEVDNGPNYAYFEAGGLGTLDIDHMTDDTGNTMVRFGWGCGCYTNCDVVQTGSGYFELGAGFTNGMTGPGGWTVGGSGTYYQHVDFTSGFSWSDYHFTVN